MLLQLSLFLVVLAIDRLFYWGSVLVRYYGLLVAFSGVIFGVISGVMPCVDGVFL